MTAQEILKLIETVSPDDTEILDEIDYAVFGYIYECDPSKSSPWPEPWSNKKRHEKNLKVIESYTTSRDALKKIRPDGWKISSLYQSGIHGWILNLIPLDGEACLNFIKNSIKPPELPTEELAELHAIIQAIEYERNKDNENK